jgi:hypothetical protein
MTMWQSVVECTLPTSPAVGRGVAVLAAPGFTGSALADWAKTGMMWAAHVFHILRDLGN